MENGNHFSTTKHTWTLKPIQLPVNTDY